MKIFKEDGYLDMDEIIGSATYIFMVLARGTGKTFGALKYAVDSGKKFIYMRRTQTQADMIRTDEMSPFVSLNRELGDDYLFKLKPVAKNVTGIYRKTINGDAEELDLIGYIMALSTISNVRGFDTSDCSLLIYDEFIGEKHEKPIRNEGMAFMNALETIGRNRELKGLDPLKVLCMANSNDLASPLFIELGLVRYAERMLRKDIQALKIPDRDIMLIIAKHSPISAKKAQTSLYRMAGDSAFTQMALDNSFSLEFTEMVKSISLKEYRPLVQVGEICIYQHKSKLLYYVTDHVSGKPEKYGSSEIDIHRFAEHYYFLKISYFNRHIYFESFILQVLFEKYFKLSIV